MVKKSMPSLEIQKIREALGSVKAPGSRLSIVEARQLARIEAQERSILVQLELDQPNPLVEKSLRYQIEKALEPLGIDLQIAVEIKQPAPKKNRIGTMLAVGSGKGGVGKSALSVNLAIAFQKLGYSVGILDCDIYGPSIPTMCGVADKKPLMFAGKIQPVEAFDLKIISAGFLVEPGQSIVWRGPMIHKLIQQFFNDVNWDGTDVLIVDLPPGTGDAPLSLSQTMPLTGAVMVSMPQHISLIDVHKGISMFHQVKVPILGVIENMSQFVCPSCEHIAEIFDRGRVKEFCEQLQVPYLGEVPIEPKIRALSDEGRPFLLDFPDSAAGKAIQSIARRLQPFIRTAEDSLASGQEIELVL